jgi:hypothetical protein
MQAVHGLVDYVALNSLFCCLSDDKAAYGLLSTYRLLQLLEAAAKAQRCANAGDT